MDIKWLDGCDANGKFILEMDYANGSKAYMKSESKDRIHNYYELLSDCPEVVQLTIYRPDQSIAVRKVCLTNLHEAA